MAENTNKTVETVATISKCSITGCVKCGESETTSDKKTYKFRVHFKSEKEIFDHAIESMNRVVAYRARSGKALPIRADGSHVDIYEDGKFVETFEDRLQRMSEMSEEQLRAEAELYAKALANRTSKNGAKG